MSCGILISGTSGTPEAVYYGNNFIGGLGGSGGAGGYSIMNPGSDGSMGVVLHVDIR